MWTEQRFLVSGEKRKEVSEYMNGFLDKILEQCKSLENHAVQADAIQMKNITDFQEAYEVRHGKEIKHMGEYVLFCITN
jgi:hypothetical protein